MPYMPYQIKPLTRGDLPAVMDLVTEFTEESLYEYIPSLASEKIESVFTDIFSTSFGLFTPKLSGVLSGLFTTDLCSPDTIYQEVLWFVTKKSRRYGIKMVQYVEDYCLSRGVHRIVFSCMHNSKTDKLFRFYEKLHFIPMETKFIKTL